MANWLKEEIAQFGETVDNSIQKASGEIQGHIDTIGKEITNQRDLTRSDIEGLIDYAAMKFGAALDERVAKAKTEMASLVTEKLAEARGQLSDAANEQKRTAVRNATVAVSSAILVGIVSLIYRRVLHGEVDLLTVFRVSLLAIAVGQIVWLLQRYTVNFLRMSTTKKSLLVTGAQYLGVFRPRGAMGHLGVFLVVVAVWACLNFWPRIAPWVGLKP